MEGVSDETVCWMSHTDYIAQVPEGFVISADTPVCPVAAMECPERKFYATQFHPEVMHTEEGMKMLSNFVYNVCGCTGDWKMDSFVESAIEQIREKVGNGSCALRTFRRRRFFSSSCPHVKSHRKAAYMRICRPRSFKKERR